MKSKTKKVEETMYHEHWDLSAYSESNPLLHIPLTSFTSLIVFLTYVSYSFQSVSLINRHIKIYYILFLGVIWLAWSGLLLKKHVSELKFALLFHAFFIVFFLWTMISTLWSFDFNISLFYCTKYLLYLIFSIAVITIYARAPTRLSLTVVKGLSLSVFILSMWYMIDFTLGKGFDVFSEPDLTIFAREIARFNVNFGGGKNLLASWICFNVTFTAPILHICFSKSKLATAVLLFSMQVLFLTVSRTAIYVLLIFIIVTFIYLRWHDFKKVMNFVPIKTLLFVIFFLIFVNPYGLTTKFVQRMVSPTLFLQKNSQTHIEREQSIEQGKSLDQGVRGRKLLWNIAWDSIEHHSILGTGIGTIWRQSKVSNDNYHNIYLQFLAQLGIIGLALFLLWSAKLFSAAYKLTKYSAATTKEMLFSKILLLNLSLYYIKALFMFQYCDLEIWTLIVFIGVNYAYRMHRFKKDGHSRSYTVLQ